MEIKIYFREYSNKMLRWKRLEFNTYRPNNLFCSNGNSESKARLYTSTFVRGTRNAYTMRGEIKFLLQYTGILQAMPEETRVKTK
jgi:hypothetical protein